MEHASPIVQKAAIGDLVGQRVLEGVGRVGKHSRLIKELGGPQFVNAMKRMPLRLLTSACYVEVKLVPSGEKQS